MFERPIYLNKMLQFKDSDAVKILAGVRGSGKSSLMKLYKMHLINEGIPVRNIVYMNFEGNDYQSINNEEKLRTVLNNLNLQIQDRIYWLFDEIQLVTGWQRVINDLKVDYDCDVVVAGSDADILSDELYDWIEIPIYPLSFQEFLEVKQISSESKFINEAYSEFEKYGGMPALLLTSEELKDTVLQGIFSSSILRDVAYKSVIKDSLTLNGVMDYLVRNTGALLNASKISNDLNSRGVYTSIPTVKRYLRLLETSYLFYHTKSYDIKAHEYLKTNSKYFIVDPGLNRCVSRGKSTMENIIYIELKRRDYNVDIGYLDNSEIVFVAKRLKEVIWIKTVYELSDVRSTMDNLNKIDDSCKKMLVSSYPQERNQTNGIEIKYIVDWLLE